MRCGMAEHHGEGRPGGFPAPAQDVSAPGLCRSPHGCSRTGGRPYCKPSRIDGDHCRSPGIRCLWDTSPPSADYSVVTLYRGDKDVPNGTIPLPEWPLEMLPVYFKMALEAHHLS